MHICSNPLLLLILPTQNNKSVKAPFTCDIQKNTVFGVGSRANRAVFATLPHPRTVFLYITRNGALTYTYC